ncbi:alpha/beta hydrolase [uncultured Arcticibacterium sp.]|uniref:alpha/beta hydrolase n=1 Tax=uncultured Arcticibacterium sp. TaxID=2173042 RepID=UPI0030F6CC8B
MKKTLNILLFLVTILSSKAQDFSGITNKKDTSFTNLSALKSAQRDGYDVKIAKSKNAHLVKSEFDKIYCQTDEYTLTVDIFSPKKRLEASLPAIIFIHGGGWRTGDKSQHHELAKELASKGYVVFTPAYRLSTFALFPAAVIDVKTSIRWIKEHPKEFGINTERIALGGYSAGGQMAAFIGTTSGLDRYENGACKINQDTEVNAVIDVDGILAYIHPESGEGDDRRSKSAATSYFGYSKEENPDLWIEGSALKHVNEFSPPILFINSSVNRMHAGREDYIKLLDKHDIYSEIHTFKAPHVFPMMDRWFEDTVELIDTFLIKIFNQ